MAKKKEILTIEEKLQNALVPDCEQPYKLPENWIYFYFTSLIDIQGGTQPPKSQFIDELKEGYIRLIQIRDFATDKYSVYIPKTPKLRTIEKKDILIARYGASIGRICTGMEGAYNVALAKTVFDDKFLHRNYIYWVLQSEIFQEPIMRISRTAQAGFNKDDLSALIIPLPPLAEQKRIVERIEGLFSKLDEAKELAQKAFDSFENRKSVILNKAFTGELTKKWREENGVLFDSWEETTLGKYADTKYGYTESANSEKVGPKFLRITDIQDSKVEWIDVPYCPISEKDFEKYSLNIGDIVIARTGATTGKSYMIADEVEAVFASYLIRVNIFDSKKLQAGYLYKFLQSSLYWNQITDLSSGIAQPGVNANKLKQILLPIPSEKEQQEIVRILDSIFAKEAEAKELVSVIDKIDLIKKSILSKAFRGELGTNDAKDENSIELLKEILEGK